MRISLTLLVIALGWIMQGCTNEADRNAIRQMEQAAPLMQSDPEAAHVLLADSVAHPELLSPGSQCPLVLDAMPTGRFDWYAVAPYG